MFRFTLICCLMHSFSSSSFFKWQSSRILNAWKKKSVSYVICYKVIYTYIKYIHMLTMKFGIFLVYKIFWWGTWVNIIHYTQILWCLISRIINKAPYFLSNTSIICGMLIFTYFLVTWKSFSKCILIVTFIPFLKTKKF